MLGASDEVSVVFNMISDDGKITAAIRRVTIFLIGNQRPVSSRIIKKQIDQADSLVGVCLDISSLDQGPDRRSLASVPRYLPPR